MRTPSVVAASILALLVGNVVATDGFLELEFKKERRSGPGRLAKRYGNSFIDSALIQDLDHSEYFINITVGTPPQKMAVQIDTGSSDLWIPAQTSILCKQDQCNDGSFDPTKSSTYKTVDAGKFLIAYVQANDVDSGDWAADDVCLPGGAMIKDFQFGLALNETVDSHGVMGIGYDSNEAAVQSDNLTIYPSIIDQLKAQHYIQRKAYSLWLNDLNSKEGSVLFGGVDTTKYYGDLIALPVVPQADGTYTDLQVSLTGITVNRQGSSKLLSNPAMVIPALLDSGNTDTDLPTPLFNSLITSLGGQQVAGNMAVPCNLASPSNNLSISYTFGGSSGPTIAVPISGLIGEALDSTPKAGAVFPDPSVACPLLGVSATNNSMATLGDTFIRYAYVVYDLENNIMALAQAKHNVTNKAIHPIPAGTGSIPGVKSTATASVVYATST